MLNDSQQKSQGLRNDTSSQQFASVRNKAETSGRSQQGAIGRKFSKRGKTKLKGAKQCTTGLLEGGVYLLRTMPILR
jgi:hypothetical protein